MGVFKRAEGAFRRALKRHPFLYAFVGGVGIVLFWRGVWLFVDFLSLTFLPPHGAVASIDLGVGADSLISLAVGIALLLSTGLFVSELLSGETVISQIKQEEHVTEETEKEVKEVEAEEETELPQLEQEVHHIAEEMAALESKLQQKKKK